MWLVLNSHPHIHDIISKFPSLTFQVCYTHFNVQCSQRNISWLSFSLPSITSFMCYWCFIHHFEIDSPKLSCFTTNSFISSLMCSTKFKLHPWVDISIQVLKSSHALCKCNVECEVNKFDMKFYKTSFFSCLHRRLVIMLCCLIVYVGCHPRPLFLCSN